jgi:hypothetical protein
VNTREEEMKEISREFQEAHGGILQWAQEHPTCPTCGGAIDAGVMLAGDGGHAHGG